MTENEFLEFLKKAWERGREAQVSAVSMGYAGEETNTAGAYLEGHSLLPVGYQEIPVDTIAEMGELLLRKGIKPSTREAIMMILAHHGCDEALRALKKFVKRAHGEMRMFAEFALQECEMWNEDYEPGRRQ